MEKDRCFVCGAQISNSPEYFALFGNTCRICDHYASMLSRVGVSVSFRKQVQLLWDFHCLFIAKKNAVLTSQVR